MRSTTASPTRRFSSCSWSSQSGSVGDMSWTSWPVASGANPSIAPTRWKRDAAAHAWGELAPGSGTGSGAIARSKPQNRWGRRASRRCWVTSRSASAIWAASSRKP